MTLWQWIIDSKKTGGRILTSVEMRCIRTAGFTLSNDTRNQRVTTINFTRKLGKYVESLSSDRFTQKYPGTAVGKICDTLERFCFIISVAGSNRPDTECFFSVTEWERALKETNSRRYKQSFFLTLFLILIFFKHSILETGSEGNFFQKPWRRPFLTKTSDNEYLWPVGVKSAVRNFVFEETLRRCIMSEVIVFVLT